jgi:transcriptional regulator with XRE-family HTH domain
MPFGVRLRELREKNGLSQSELAERVGIPIDSIQNWEQGRTRPRIEALGKLARALGVTLDELLQESGEPAEPDQKRPRKRK